MKHLKLFNEKTATGDKDQIYTSNKNKPDTTKFRIGDIVKRIPWGNDDDHMQTDKNFYQIIKIQERSEPYIFNNSILKYSYQLKNINRNENNAGWVWEQDIVLATDYEVNADKYNI